MNVRGGYYSSDPEVEKALEDENKVVELFEKAIRNIFFGSFASQGIYTQLLRKAPTHLIDRRGLPFEESALDVFPSTSTLYTNMGPGFRVQNPTIRSPLIEPFPGRTPPTMKDSPHSPEAPTFTLTSGFNAADSLFLQSTGVFYVVTGLNEFGESLPSEEHKTFVPAGNVTYLDIVEQEDVQLYRIYRKDRPDTRFSFIGTSRSGKFIDTKTNLPKTGTVFVIPRDSDAFNLVEYSSLLKVPLLASGMTEDFLYMWYISPFIRNPENIYIFKNVGEVT